MKAEHRKELHTNALAAKMNQFIEASRTTGKAIWGVLLLVVIVIVTYWFWTTKTTERLSSNWSQYLALRSGGSVGDLEDAAKALKGTAAERAANLALADQLYEEGYRLLFSSTTLARESFDRAAKLYEDLDRNPGNVSEIGMRALLGLAKTKESTGEIDKARDAYQKLSMRYGKEKNSAGDALHPLVAEAQERLKELNNQEGLAFYKEWPSRLPKMETKKPAGTPPEPPDPLKPPD